MSGLRVAVNTLLLTRESRGGLRTVLTRLVPALVRVGGDHRFRLICSNANVDLFEAVGDGVERVVLPTTRRRPLVRVWHDQITVPRLVRDGTDVLFTPSTVGSMLAPVPEVVAVAAHLALPSVRRDVPGARLSLAHRVYYGPVMRASHRRATAVTPISAYLGRQLVLEAGLDAAKMETIPCGVDAVDSTPGVDGRYALFIGTLYPYKNAAAAVDALALARARLPDHFRLVVVGRDPDGRQIPALASRAASAGVGDVVDLLGPVEQERLDRLYRDATVLVLPSRAEGFGLPVLEAMARGVPVVSSNTTALPEVVGDAGLLVDPDRPEELADRLVDVATDPSLRDQLVAAGRRRAGELSWDRAARAYVELFERVARRGGSASHDRP